MGTKKPCNSMFTGLYVSPSGFEPETASLEGRCSIQLSYEPINSKKKGDDFSSPLVGVAGFEPATSSSQTRRDDRATLHPEYLLLILTKFQCAKAIYIVIASAKVRVLFTFTKKNSKKNVFFYIKI